MIPSAYPVVGLVAVLVLIAAVILAPCLRAFRRAWFVIAAALAVIWAGDKPPTPPPPVGGIVISLAGTTVSNVTVNVNSPTNLIGRVATWQTRRRVGMADGVPLWSDWDSLAASYFISSTNETRTVEGRFVGGGKDTKLRLAVDDGPSNGVDL